MGKNKKLPQKSDPCIRNFGLTDLQAQNDDGNTIEGHAAVYGQRVPIGDYFYEVIEPGAFNRCNFDDVLLSINHDLSKIPLARSRRNNTNSTMQLQVVDKGLYFRASLDIEKNPEAQALYSAVQRSDLDGMSFIFYISKETWEDLETDMPTRRIQEIEKVQEISVVSFPAYAGTDINARDQIVLDNASKVLENARSKLDNSRSEQQEIEGLRLKNQILMKMEKKL